MRKRRFTSLMAFLLLHTTSVLRAAVAVSGLCAFHRQGQTFLTWRERGLPPVTEPVDVVTLRSLRQQLTKRRNIRFRVYRSKKPLVTVEGKEPIAEIPPLSCWNLNFYGIYPKPGQRAFRYTVKEGGPPCAAHTGLFVFNPPESGKAYYAVSAVEGQRENRRLGRENSLHRPVEEQVGPGLPVLQRREKVARFNYVPGATLYFYVRWEPPEHCPRQGMPFDYLVAVPPAAEGRAPVGIHLHCWGGNLTRGYGWWYNAERGAILVASNQIPYDWWTGYHQYYWSGPPHKELWRKGVVRAYTQRRLLSFLTYVSEIFPVDLTRTFVAGSSMGGSGAPMLAIRHPDRIAWAVSWVGVHVPAASPQFKSSYARVYGEPPWKVRFEDGTPVWDYFNDVWYLRHFVRKEVGPIIFSNGKNDGAIGWPQAVSFYRALQETKRPHVFLWGQGGHGQRTRMPGSLQERVLPIDISTDQSCPAFANCSLDDDPGDGDPKRGDPAGQSNLYLWWDSNSIVERRDRWEIQVALVQNAPQASCVVDVTPRRLRRFKPPASSWVSWRAVEVAGQRVLAQGKARVDRFGLVTARRVPVTNTAVRLIMETP